MKSNSLKTTGLYTLATFEYMGLYTYSLIMKRGGYSVITGSKWMALPVYNAVKTSCVYMKNKLTQKERKKFFLHQIQLLQNKVSQLENKVANIEKFGVAMQSNSNDVKKIRKKEVGSEKKHFLKAILNDNKMILGR